MVATRRAPAAGQQDYRWADYDDEALLDLRFSRLGLKFRGSPLWTDVERLLDEFDRRGLRFRPHVWLSTDWFSPDGVPGFAVPFYLAHPRLQQAGTDDDGRGGGRQPQVASPHHASRSRPCHRQCLRAQAPGRLAARIRPCVGTLPRHLFAAPEQPSPRAAPRALVRAEPPDGGLRGDVRRLAAAEGALAPRLCRLAGAQEARVRRCTDGRDREQQAEAPQPVGHRAVTPGRADAGGVLPPEARALRRHGAPLRSLD